jgi:YcaO-like protein with predicted kinase domain
MKSDVSGAKVFLEGTHRVTDPLTTLQQVGNLMPEMGITRIANVTGLDRLQIPVAFACRPNSRGLSVSQGKGLSVDAAKASALMEAVESYHAERITAPLRCASFDDLVRDSAVVDPDQLPAASGLSFDRSTPTLWIEGQDIVTETTIWVPYEIVETNYTLPFADRPRSFQCTTNGLASGNHPLEAILHGVCEVVERDAVAVWSARSIEYKLQSRVDLNTVDEADCRRVLDIFVRAGLSVDVWDITSDIGIPAFRARIVDISAGSGCSYSADGTGAHPSRSIALLRALTEAAQCRLTLITGSRDDIFRADYERERRQAEHDDHVDLQLDTVQQGLDFREGPGWLAPTLEEDVSTARDQLRAAGLSQLIVVDLTRSEFGIPVVRVIIPGLEGVSTAPGYVPGARATRDVGQRP